MQNNQSNTENDYLHQSNGAKSTGLVGVWHGNWWNVYTISASTSRAVTRKHIHTYTRV